MASIISSDSGLVSGVPGLKTSADATGALQIQTGNNVTAITVDAIQNVGIGTTSPLFRLNAVQGSGSAAPSVRESIQIYAKGYGGSGQQYAGIGFAMSEHTNGYWGSGILARDDTNSYGAALAFYTSTGAASATPTEKMRIDSSGNVGIGTASPVSKLHVAGTFTITGAGMQIDNGQGISAKSVAGTSRQLVVMDGSNNLVLGGTVDAGILFMTSGGNERMRIDTSGNVGIGNAAPDRKLYIVGGARTGSLVSDIFAISDGATYTLDIPISTSEVSLRTNLNNLSFQTVNSEKMRIDSSGNVGIGTASPGEKLHVSGNIRMSSVAGTNTNAALPVLFQTSTGTIEGGSGLTYNPGGDALGVNGMSITASTVSGAGSSATFTCANGAGQYDFVATSDSLRFTAGSSERMRIDSSGSVMVGTTSSGGFKFIVKGTVSGLLTRVTDGVTQSYDIGTSSTGVFFDTPNNGYYAWQTASSERMRITTAGLVGIGTSSPTHKLDVDGVVACTTNSNGSLPTATSGLAIAQNYGGGTAGSAEIDFIFNSATYVGDNGGFRFYQRTGASTTQEMLRLTQNSVITYTGGAERMRINSSGNVGIGTTSISALLHVASGSASILNYRTGTWAAKIFNQNDSADYNGLIVGNRWAADSSTVFEVGTLYGGGSAWGSFYKVLGSGIHTFGVSSGSAAPNERMRINDFGIGLNGSSPTSGIGIMFPASQSASSNANTLDDYEEGTWTPNVNGSASGTFSTRVGTYVKIGKQVTIWFRCDGGNSGTGGATQYVDGLPFNVGTYTEASMVGTMGTNGPAIRIQNLLTLTANRAVLYIYNGGSQETTPITYASGTATYFVD